MTCLPSEVKPAPPVSHPITPNKATNENTITITVPPAQPVAACSTETSHQILVNPQPLKLNVDTSTDWPTVIATMLVGIGSICTTLLVGWLTYVNQRTQIRSATANFRQGWQAELRQVAAKFVSLTAKVHFEIESDRNYLNSPASNKDYSDLIAAQATIELMLDPKKDSSATAVSLTEKIVAAVRENKKDVLTLLVNNFTSEMNKILEQAWQDIRKDLGARNAK